MHWSEKLADEIIKRNPDKDEYVCAAGISPSGSIHIGNFRDIATSFFIVKALQKKGRKAKLLFSWDEFDRMRKVPANVAEVTENFEQYIGYPYVDVPNPFGGTEQNYALYFEQEFEKSITRFGIQMDYRHQAELYRSGKYRDHILTALDKRGEIFDILDSFRTQDAQEGERAAYYPVSIYCPVCHRDTTTITSYQDDTHTAAYTCKCGHCGTFDFTKDTNCKLAWKIDWPMRWMYEGVDFEPGGKDHAAPGGSYNTSKVIAEKIFGIRPPLFQGYEFIGIRGATGKMSGSTGLNLTPDTLLKIYQPEIILWLYSRVEPGKAFNLCFDDGILRQYFEFDKQYQDYINGTANEHVRSVIEYSLISDRKISTVPMGLLVQLGSIVDFNVEMLETVFRKINQPYQYKDFAERLELARYWLENCAPEQANKLVKHRNWKVYNALSEDLKKEITLLHEYLSHHTYTLDELNTELYAIPKKLFGENAENLKALQGEFFKSVYRLLLGKDKGPRLYLFLYAIDKDSYVRLLDFSTPMTEEEQDLPQEAQAVPVRKAVTYGAPDPVPALKPEIQLADFAKLDLRVCKILKCTEIRKSHSCYKLTLFDGLRERVIVSSIKQEYTPEELIGRKIIVVANLASARITGVTSEGMLLAATNTACGCKILFVDDSVPEGTPIS